jgi:hypothetical protein
MRHAPLSERLACLPSLSARPHVALNGRRVGLLELARGDVPTALDLTALRRLAVLDSAAAADASRSGAVVRDDAFLLFFMPVNLLFSPRERLPSAPLVALSPGVRGPH